MNRWILCFACATLGLAMLVCGLLMPVHLRAVDAGVIQAAGRNTPTFLGRGLALVDQTNLGAAEMYLRVAQARGMPDQGKLALAADGLAARHPGLVACGSAEPALEFLFQIDRPLTNPRTEPFTEFIVRPEARERALARLTASANPAVQELLRLRRLTNTVIFSPSESASGQALDAAISVCGLLLECGHWTAGLSNAVLTLAVAANRSGNSEPIEQVLLDVMSLGQRFNWGQLAAFVGRMDGSEPLRLLAGFVRKDYNLPVLFAAVQLSGNPSDVAQYLVNFSQTGLTDLGDSLRFGAGGVNELLRRHQPLHTSPYRERLAARGPLAALLGVALDYSWRQPWLALTVKWFLYLGAGFLLAAAVHCLRRVTELERPLEVRGFHLVRESLFALGFLLVVLLLSEPFLARESQKVEFRFQLRLPTVGSVVPVGTPGNNPSFMNHKVLLTMLLFFVLQALLYIASLLKLAEIRRQRVLPPMKLRLLENEDHLFDAGLYLGFLGTIVSLILASLGVFKQTNLMAAYSSTSFGILFVVLFKVVHLRPARRKLLLEAEAGSRGPAERPAPSLAAPL